MTKSPFIAQLLNTVRKKSSKGLCCGVELSILSSEAMNQVNGTAEDDVESIDVVEISPTNRGLKDLFRATNKEVDEHA